MSFTRLVTKLAAPVPKVESFKRGLFIGPHPDVASECHIDHKRVGETAKKLAFLAPFEKIMKEYGAESAPVKAIAFYMTAKPNRYVKTTGFFNKQLDVLRHEFPSQYPQGNAALESVILYLNLRAHEYGLRRFACTAERFRVLGTTQMHCLPEAGE